MGDKVIWQYSKIDKPYVSPRYHVRYQIWDRGSWYASIETNFLLLARLVALRDRFLGNFSAVAIIDTKE